MLSRRGEEITIIDPLESEVILDTGEIISSESDQCDRLLGATHHAQGCVDYLKPWL